MENREIYANVVRRVLVTLPILQSLVLKTMNKCLKYAECIFMGHSIRKNVKKVEINIATTFYWRHKILGAIKSFTGVGSVEGIIEADETFFSKSFKGNNKNSQ